MQLANVEHEVEKETIDFHLLKKVKRFGKDRDSSNQRPLCILNVRQG